MVSNVLSRPTGTAAGHFQTWELAAPPRRGAELAWCCGPRRDTTGRPSTLPSGARYPRPPARGLAKPSSPPASGAVCWLLTDAEENVDLFQTPSRNCSDSPPRRCCGPCRFGLTTCATRTMPARPPPPGGSRSWSAAGGRTSRGSSRRQAAPRRRPAFSCRPAPPAVTPPAV